MAQNQIIKTTNVASGEVIYWESKSKLLRSLRMGMATLNAALKENLIHRGLRFEFVPNKPYEVHHSKRQGESNKDYIGRQSGMKSIKLLALELGITTEEVKKLFDEWLADRRERGDWELYPQKD